MLKLTPHQCLLLAIEPTDFRRSIDGLAAICKQKLRLDPFLVLFLFLLIVNIML